MPSSPGEGHNDTAGAECHPALAAGRRGRYNRAVPAGSLRAHVATLRAFSYPAYRWLWLGAFVSNVGTWIQNIALGVWVTQTTGKAGWTGTIAGLSYLPTVFLAPITGALADRWDRRRLIAALSLVQVACAAGLAVLGLTGRLSLPGIAALVLASGCAAAASGPAFNALLSEIVKPDDLLSAVSLSSAQFNLARTVGPMLAAVVLSFGGVGAAFVGNAVCTVAVVVAVLWARGLPARRPVPPGSLSRGVLEGFRVARTDPGIRLALLVVTVLTILIAPFIGLIPAFAIKVFGRDVAGVSALATSQGLGALVAAFTANAVALRWGVRRFVTRALLVVPPVAIAYWLAPRFGLALAALALLGGVYLWCLSALSTICMGRVGRDLQARMNSLYSVALSGGYVLGLVVLGWLGDRLGLRAVPVAAALAFFALVLVLRARRAFAAVDAPGQFGGALPSRPPDESGP
jgi:predicted MFS family arabinose efflux permease